MLSSIVLGWILIYQNWSMLQSTYIQPFKSEIQIINHWIAISGHKHGFCSIRPHGFLGAVEYVLFGRETKIPCDSSVAGISQTLRWRHVLRHAFCMLTSVFLAERNEENNKIWCSIIGKKCLQSYCRIAILGSSHKLQQAYRLQSFFHLLSSQTWLAEVASSACVGWSNFWLRRIDLE